MKNIYVTLLLLFSAVLFGKTADTLGIDPHAGTIIAPDGLSYQWYLNGTKLKGTNQKTFKVCQPGQYAVEVVDLSGDTLRLQSTLAINATGAITKIYLIGDSTVCNYAASAYPMTGWGMVLGAFFNANNIAIDNRAIGGRSSRSFFEEGRWTPIKNALEPGDYVFIQFGHNDRDTKPERYTSTTDYKKFLTTYVNDTKAKGAIPVLVSPMVMNAWRNGTMRNIFTEPGNDYRGAMLEVANSLNVAFVDLNMKSWNLYKALGADYITRFVYHTYPAGEYPNYPNGISDGTHFQEMGAIDNARMVVEGIGELSNRSDMATLVQNLKPQYKVTVAVNPTGADLMTTRSANYPQGLTITLKTLPKTAGTFQTWNNASNAQIATSTLHKVITSAATATYTAVYQGATVTCTTDVCGRCVGGSTGLTACTSTAEAETEACSYDGVVESVNTGFGGTGYLNGNNAVGNAITFTINASTAGTKTLSFRYANGSTNDRTANLILNSVALSNTLSFPSTGTFSTWKTIDISLNLLKGDNILTLAAVQAEGLANIDQIGYVSMGLSKGSCIVTSTTDEDIAHTVSLYPNPSADQFMIEAPTPVDAQLYNHEGQLIISFTQLETLKFGDNLSKGIYLLKVHNQSETKVFKIVKQ